MGDMNNEGVIRQFGRAIWPFVVYLAGYEITAYLLQTALAWLLQMGTGELRIGILGREGDVSALLTALSMTAGYLVVFRMAGQEVVWSGKLVCSRVRAAVFAAGAVFLALFLNVLISISAPAGVSGPGTASLLVSPVLGILVYGVLSPAIEEIVFRGLVYGRLLQGSALGRLGAALLSSLLFALYHGNVTQGIYAFCMGVFFCRFLDETGSLPAVAALHGAINLIVLFLSQNGWYEGLCTPAWTVCFLGAAACCGIALRFLPRFGS